MAHGYNHRYNHAYNHYQPTFNQIYFAHDHTHGSLIAIGLPAINQLDLDPYQALWRSFPPQPPIHDPKWLAWRASFFFCSEAFNIAAAFSFLQITRPDSGILMVTRLLRLRLCCLGLPAISKFRSSKDHGTNQLMRFFAWLRGIGANHTCALKRR